MLLCLKQRSVNLLKQCIWHYNVRNAIDSGCLTLFIVEFLFYHIHCSMFLMLVFYVFVFYVLLLA